MEKAAKASESARKQLEGPEFPDVGARVWEVFLDLHAARPSGGMGPGSITFEGIRAWCDLMGEWLTPWEVSTIKELDALWLSETAKARQNG